MYVTDGSLNVFGEEWPKSISSPNYISLSFGDEDDEENRFSVKLIQ